MNRALWLFFLPVFFLGALVGSIFFSGPGKIEIDHMKEEIGESSYKDGYQDGYNNGYDVSDEALSAAEKKGYSSGFNDAVSYLKPYHDSGKWPSSLDIYAHLVGFPAS